MERRVRIDLAYDGTAYAGWQMQSRARTVQQAVEEAIRKLHAGRRVPLRGAGRTDSGAHARGQVADAWIALDRDDDALCATLSDMLPPDIRPQRVLTVPDTFNARHDARSKTYRYLLQRRPGDPFLARFAERLPSSWDEGRVDAALALLPGTRDWSGFTGSACRVADRTRTLVEARRVVLRPGLQALVFSADGFLTHMVRNIVGTLIEVGRGKLDRDRVSSVLTSLDRKLAGPTAPAKGLCLERVVYDDALGGASGETEGGHFPFS
jgi:tRNA pseudouridine38-40 synthase